jgi:hypothetical protein
MFVKGSTAIAGTAALVATGAGVACRVDSADADTAKASSTFEELPISTMKV